MPAKIQAFSVVPTRITKDVDNPLFVNWDCPGAAEGEVSIEFFDEDGNLIENARPATVPGAHGIFALSLDRSATCVLKVGDVTASVKVIAEAPEPEPEPEPAPIEVPEDERPTEKLVAPAPDLCPTCGEKAPPFVPPVGDSLFDARLERVKADYFPDGEGDDKQAVERFVRIQGGYIARCPCGTDFFVRVEGSE